VLDASDARSELSRCVDSRAEARRHAWLPTLLLCAASPPNPAWDPLERRKLVRPACDRERLRRSRR
jgi:hypothetical protein